MQDTGRSADINQAMNHLPPAAAEPADPFSSGCDGEREQQNKTDEAGDDERALQEYVLQDLTPREVLIQPDVCREVKERIEECEQPEHPSKPDETAPADDAPKR